MNKKILSILLAVMMALSVASALPVMAFAGNISGLYDASHIHGEGADAVIFTDWDGGTEHNSMPTEAGNFVLTSDITLSSTWSLPSGTTNLCLNEHVLKLATGASGNVILMPSGKNPTFNLYDSETASKKYYFDKDEANGVWTLSEDQTNPTDNFVVGGCITGGNSACGGGINIESGTFNMYGGNIVGNKAAERNNSDGGGIYLRGTFNMKGGSITGNYARHNGGAISFNGGSNSVFNMKGGSLKDNTAAYIGGVCVSDTCTFTMNDGVISSNSAIDPGQGTTGGVCIINGGTFYMNGGKISKNKAYELGGGVTVQGAFYMSGGEISENSTERTASCGGVYVDGRSIVSSSMVIGGTAKIIGNTVGGGDTLNNLFVDAGKTIAIGTKTNSDEGNKVPVPAEGMLVGITLGDYTGAFTSNGAADIANYFFPDSNDCYIKENEGKLELGEVADTDKYSVWVDGTQVNEYNKNDLFHDGGKVSYDSVTNTLTLNGAEIGMTGSATGFTYGNACGIKSELDDLKIYLKGINKIGTYKGTDIAAESDDGLEPTIQKFTADAGIFSSRGDITFAADEDASLTITDYGVGIQADNITFGSDFEGMLKVFDFGGMEPMPPCAISATKTLTIGGGTFDLISYQSNGISAKNIAINGCLELKVKGKAGEEGIYAVASDNLAVASTLEVINSSYTAGVTTSLNPSKTSENGGYVTIKPHSHNIVKVSGQASTESAAGWKDYYECKGTDTACHMYFEDSAGLIPISDLSAWKTGSGKINKLEHKVTKVSGQIPKVNSGGWKDYYECQSCGKKYEDAEGKTEIANLDVWKAKGGNGYIPSLNEIKAAKAAAKEALDNENAKAPLFDETALIDGKSAIDKATTLEGIESAKADGIEAIRAAQKAQHELDWLWWTLGIVAVVLLGGFAVYFFVIRKKKA